jgi:hypothetical protein
LRCAGVCAKRRICSMFSVSAINTTLNTQTAVQCNVAYGYSSWTADQNSLLYIGKLKQPTQGQGKARRFTNERSCYILRAIWNGIWVTGTYLGRHLRLSPRVCGYGLSIS